MSLAVRSLSWVTRNIPKLPGRWRIVHWLDQNEARFAALPPKTVRFARDFQVRINPVDENGRWIYVNGYQAQERLTRHFVRLLHPGDCVIDIGANVGYYTMAAAKLVGPSGCVHAFEASPEVFSWLRTNAELNPHANIHLHNQAVTDRCGDVTFYTAAADRTGYSSMRDLGDGARSKATVPGVTIDSMLDEIPTTRLVKIDVEGAELLVLSGMRGLIERDRPHVILEIDDVFLRELGASADQQCDFLRDAGYELFRIAEKGALQPITAAPTDRCNILAQPART
ncbi:MAG: FkbM family methyltransferase [Planctomycetes bacterium]|nr:FkbM family methyltransferase [Planctomycetota bacterium]